MPADTTKISIIIRDARRAKNLTQEALAEKLGISARTIGDIETEKRKPSYRILNKLVYALNIPRNLLFPEEASEISLEAELFVSKFKASTPEEQALVMATAEGIWAYFRINQKEKI